MTAQPCAEKLMLEELLARVRRNRALLGAAVPRSAMAAASPAPAAIEGDDVDASPTDLLYPPRRSSAPPPPAPTPVVPPEAAGPPAPPPPLPTVTVSAAARAPAATAATATVRIQAAPPRQAPVVGITGAVVPVPPRTIGGLLRAALRVGAGK